METEQGTLPVDPNPLVRQFFVKTTERDGKTVVHWQGDITAHIHGEFYKVEVWTSGKAVSVVATLTEMTRDRWEFFDDTGQMADRVDEIQPRRAPFSSVTPTP